MKTNQGQILFNNGIYPQLINAIQENKNSKMTFISYIANPPFSLLEELHKNNIQGEFICTHPKNINSGRPITKDSLKRIINTKHRVFGYVSSGQPQMPGNLHAKIITFEYNNNYRIYLTSANCTPNSLYNYTESFYEMTDPSEKKTLRKEIQTMLKNIEPIKSEDILNDETESEDYKPEPTKEKFLSINGEYNPNRKYLRESYEALMKHNFEKENRFIIAAPPGTGKTMQAAYFVYHEYILKGKRVLWVSHNGQLLKQAMETFFKLGMDPKLIDRFGSTPELSRLIEKENYQLLSLSSIQTLHNLLKDDVNRVEDLEPDSIVIDENWGLEEQMYGLLKEYSLSNNTPILALSATPKQDSWFSKKVKGNNTFIVTTKDAEKNKIIAKPIFYMPDTGITWCPQKDSKNLIPERYFNELSQIKSRNKFILETYLNKKHKNKKTLIFACNKEHARVLNNLFKSHCRSAEYHSDKSNLENKEVFNKFKNSEIDVLITVNKFIYGIDVPDIESIFMTRPTESVPLFIQMIGRGARTNDGQKLSFEVVEFTDNCENHKIKFVDHRSKGILL